MFLIQNISDYPTQSKTLNLPDGSLINITISFVPMQKSWVFRKIEYGDFVVHNVKIVKSPNILRQFKNIIPFGIACDSLENRDPYFVQDFSSRAFSLYLLSREEVQAFEDVLSGI